MSLFEAILLGILQGLAEFLPISSSGHLEIGAAVLGVQSGNHLLFTVTVHVATVLSTIVVFWRDIVAIASSVLRFRNDENSRYFLLLLLSAVPVGIVGVFFKDEVESLFGGSLLIVGISLLGTSTLLFLGQRMGRRNSGEVNTQRSIIIGLAQAVAVLPGLSRSGTTIAAGLLAGVKRESVARFSFLMVVLPILGEGLLDGVKLAKDPSLAAGIGLDSLLAGFITAFVVGYFACRFMLKYVRKGNLYVFVGYCTVVGLACIVWAATR